MRRKAVERLEAMLVANDKLSESIRNNFTTYHDAAGNLWMKLGRYEKEAGDFEIVRARV